MVAEETMRAVYLVEAGKFALEEVPVPTPGPRDVLVKVRACGVCGSDIHFYEKGRIGDFVIRKPVVPGHECAGDVIEIGAEVRTIDVGDRVALEPFPLCRAALRRRRARRPTHRSPPAAALRAVRARWFDPPRRDRSCRWP